MSELVARFDLPVEVEAPATARHVATSLLHGWGFHDDEWIGRAQVVVSELVTNAVVHSGGSRLSLELRADHGRVTIAAIDQSAAAPRPREPDDTSGRGLWLVKEMSAAWGVDGHNGGKRVWAQVGAHTQAGGRHRRDR